MKEIDSLLQPEEQPRDMRFLITMGALMALFAAACWYGPRFMGH